MAKAKKEEKKVTRKLTAKRFNELKKYFTNIAVNNTNDEESVVLTSSTKDGNRTIKVEWQVVEFKHDYKGNTQKGLYIDAVHTKESVKGQSLSSFYNTIKNAIRLAVYDKIEEQKGLKTGYVRTDESYMFIPNEKTGKCRKQKAYEISQNNDLYLDDNYVKQVKAILKEYIDLLNEEFNTINEFMVLDFENRKNDFEEYKQTLTVDKRKQSYKHELTLEEYKDYRDFYKQYIEENRTDIQKQTEEKTEKKEPIKVTPTFKNTKASL